MSRPGPVRTASTNLISQGGRRPLDGKLAVVTGASRGIGAATCQYLASKGASLVMNYTSDSSTERTQKLAQRLETEHGIKALPVQADMGSANGPAHIVATAQDHFAHAKTRKFQIDIIVNNAGINSHMSIEDTDVELFSKMYNVNVRGPLLLMQAARQHLPRDRSGRIVNVSSVSASLGFHKQSIYGGTKAALEAMTRTWARELGERATVNAVNPGPVATDMYGGAGEDFQRQMSHFTRSAPLAAVRPGIDRREFVDSAEFNGGRPAYEEEIAGIIGMLCSTESGWCTGSVICSNGGFKFST